MVTYTNRVKDNFRAGRQSYGVHVKMPAPGLVDVAGNSGSDFVKFDQYHAPFSAEVMVAMIAAARANALTPWIRCRGDAHEIMTMLDMGAEAITVPSIGSAEQAKAVVDATRYFPRGVRESNRPLARRGMKDEDYFTWAKTEILVCASIEDKAGLDNYCDIVKVEGIDVIVTGRGDISLALGVPHDSYNQPAVIDAQKRVILAALDAGKQVSMTYQCTPQGLEEARRWVEKGVRIVTLETEHKVLARTYSSAFDHLRAVRLSNDKSG